MSKHLGWIGLVLVLLASGLTACSVQPLANAEPLMMIRSTETVPPTATATFTPTATRTPSRTPKPTRTATAQPTATIEPTPLVPTAVLTPIPNAPPLPDGVARTADVPILMYHYISAAPSVRDLIRYGLSVPPDMFEAQLKLLHDNGFTTVTLRDVYNYLAVGTPLPDKPIVLTFDDGYLDNYTNAFRILQKYGMVGTFFVLTGKADAGDPAYLSWDMIQAMSNAGMDIQLHARDHLDMRNRSYDWLVFQIIGGRQSIEGHTGKPVIFMAYPSGKYDANVLRFLKATNFWAAVTTAYGRQHTLGDALIWDRIRIAGQLRLSDFARLLGIDISAQHIVTQPSATPTFTPQSTKRGGSLSPTKTMVPTMIPPRTQPPRSTPTAPPGAPTRTPISSPLDTPTPPQSPIITPRP